MINNKHRPGYKKIKVGWIPEEWTFGRIGDFFDVTSGSTPSRLQHDDYFLNGDVEWVKTMDLNNSMLFKTSERITKKGLKESSCKMLPINTVLVAMYGGFNQIGRTGLLKMEAACNQALSAILPSKSYNAEFLLAWLNSQVLYWKKLSASSRKDPNITKNDVNDFPLIIPPLPEQIAIAEVLECWDKGIRTLEKKIEKKRLVKNGLMQKLLSGETRLPKFSKPWKNISLGKVFNLITTYAFSREKLTTEDVDNGDIYNIHYGDIHATYTGAILDLGKERRVPMLISSDALPSKMEFLKDGDLIMADVSEDYEGIGACLELKNIGARKVTGGLHTFVLRDAAEQTAEGFRGYLFREYGVAKELKRIATGVSVYSISKSKLIEVKLHLPPLEEQRAIAKVLEAADAEIDALESKLALFKDQKKYLLNNLVTGTIRLPQFENSLP